MNKTDPTGQARNRKRSAGRLNKRLRAARKRIIQRFRAVPFQRSSEQVIVNASSITIHDYEMSSAHWQEFTLFVKSVLDEELVTSLDLLPADWWFSEDVEVPFRQGALTTLNEYNQMVAAGALAGTVAAQQLDASLVLLSKQYADTLRDAVIRNYDLIKILSDDTAAKVLERIRRGIDSGLSPSTITDDIIERFEIARSNVERITRTEINRAYNDARINAATNIQGQTGARVGLLHISALIPSTRVTHAERHGKAYTPAQQTAWWNSDANRINCLCTTRTVLIDDDGKVIQSELQKEIKNEGDFFKKAV